MLNFSHPSLHQPGEKLGIECVWCAWGIQSELAWKKCGGARNFVYLPLQCLDAHVDILESSAH